MRVCTPGCVPYRFVGVCYVLFLIQYGIVFLVVCVLECLYVRSVWLVSTHDGQYINCPEDKGLVLALCEMESMYLEDEKNTKSVRVGHRCQVPKHSPSGKDFHCTLCLPPAIIIPITLLKIHDKRCWCRHWYPARMPYIHL